MKYAPTTRWVLLAIAALVIWGFSRCQQCFLIALVVVIFDYIRILLGRDTRPTTEYDVSLLLIVLLIPLGILALFFHDQFHTF